VATPIKGSGLYCQPQEPGLGACPGVAPSVEAAFMCACPPLQLGDLLAQGHNPREQLSLWLRLIRADGKRRKVHALSATSPVTTSNIDAGLASAWRWR
jgi:hypothetical protein